jgi:sterol desaturase/sphingolipid hydroxylase (fatty acid hydroxylase superfamily)
MVLGLNWQELIQKFIHSFNTNAVRYLSFSIPLFLLMYVWKKREFFKFKIQQKFPENKHIIREIGYSFLSIAIFSIVATIVFLLRKQGHAKIYSHFSDHSVAYFIFSVVAFILIHDAYFYWTHRLMHWKKIYRYVHRVHHQSTDPTPWAAFAFHPLEALIEIGILPIMVFLIPLHHYAILVWVIYQSGMNLLGHLGFELYPSGFVSGTISKWNNTSTHHNMHHRFVNCNYGLYFNFWDRILGTNHVRYEEEFEKIKTRVKESRQSSMEPEYSESLAN